MNYLFMKLIIKRYVTDGCTYSDDVYETIEYESADKAAYDLLVLWEAALKDYENPKSKNGGYFEFCGHKYSIHDFRQYSDRYTGILYEEPQILTLEEFWLRNLSESQRNSLDGGPNV